MALKDYLQSDLDAFISQDEFASLHTIDGRLLSVVVDNDRLTERSKKEFDGISVGDLLFFVSAEEFGARPKQDSLMKFDSKIMQVFDVREDEGMYEIILRRNE